MTHTIFGAMVRNGADGRQSGLGNERTIGDDKVQAPLMSYTE